MSLTKLGTELTKEAFIPAALAGIRAGFGLFKNNIGSAIGKVGLNVLPAMQKAVKAPSVYQGASRLGKITSPFRALKSGLMRGVTGNESKALSYGAKGLGITAAIGMGTKSGNKDYNNTINDINRWNQYKMTDPSYNTINASGN